MYLYELDVDWLHEISILGLMPLYGLVLLSQGLEKLLVGLNFHQRDLSEPLFDFCMVDDKFEPAASSRAFQRPIA